MARAPGRAALVGSPTPRPHSSSLSFLLYLAGLGALFNVSKLLALTAIGFWFMTVFEALSWVVLISLIIPWVDVFSVWRGPTEYIVSEQPSLFDRVSIAFRLPGEEGSANIGPPDILFFALFLAAADRFGLRVRWTWFSMVGLLVADADRDRRARPHRPAGATRDLPRLPASRTPTASGAPGASAGSRCRSRGEPSAAAAVSVRRRTTLEQVDRLDVRRVREHVDGAAANELVAEVLAKRLQVGGERRRIARHVDDPRRLETAEPPERLAGETGTRRIDDDEVGSAGALLQLLERERDVAGEERRVRDPVQLRVLDRARDRLLGDLDAPDRQRVGANVRPIVPVPQ